MHKQRCDKCYHYEKDERVPGQGRCHHEPPKVFMILHDPSGVRGVLDPNSRQAPQPGFISAWPAVRDGECCGQWTPAIDTPAGAH